MNITRYEIKFLVTHSQARAILRHVKGALVPDPYGDQARYRVTSVYFDSPGHDAYWEKIDGESVRRKLRLRFYGVIEGPRGLDNRPYFLELKYRRKDTVYKDRVRIAREHAAEILNDASVLRDLVTAIKPTNAQDRSVLFNIENYASAAWLQPSDTISYEREAWQGAVDERVRVTFDRVVHAYPPEVYTNVDAHSGLPIIQEGQCVMEVKFNNLIPAWLRSSLVHECLAPRRFSKYANGLEAIGAVAVRSQKAARAARSILRPKPVGFESSP